MKVGVHQSSVLSLLLFIIVLEALLRDFRAGVPGEDHYADDLALLLTPWMNKSVEGGNGEEGAESERGEDHDRWYRP